MPGDLSQLLPLPHAWTPCAGSWGDSGQADFSRRWPPGEAWWEGCCPSPRRRVPARSVELPLRGLLSWRLTSILRMGRLRSTEAHLHPQRSHATSNTSFKLNRRSQPGHRARSEPSCTPGRQNHSHTDTSPGTTGGPGWASRTEGNSLTCVSPPCPVWSRE